MTETLPHQSLKGCRLIKFEYIENFTGDLKKKKWNIFTIVFNQRHFFHLKKLEYFISDGLRIYTYHIKIKRLVL